MAKGEKALGIVYAVFIGFLFGYLFGILMCKKMPERFGIVQKESGCSCECCEGTEGEQHTREEAMEAWNRRDDNG
jgi:hypothetical protein